MCTRFLLYKGIYPESYTAFLSCNSSKSEKGVVFNYIPQSKFSQQLHCELWYLYEMKIWLFSIRYVHSFFKKSFGIWNKVGKCTPDFNFTEGCLNP